MNVLRPLLARTLLIGLLGLVLPGAKLAHAADSAEEARLKAALSRQVGRDVNLRVVLNPAVMGGVRVSLGDEVIEGTVAGRLADAERRLG